MDGAVARRQGGRSRHIQKLTFAEDPSPGTNLLAKKKRLPPAPSLNLAAAIPDLRHNATPVSSDNPVEDVIASSPRMLMSNRSSKPLSTLLIASFAGSMLAMIAHGSAHADDNCLSGPKATTPRGSHWYYRIEPGTKRHCWYLGAERGKTAQTAAAKPPTPASTPAKPASASAKSVAASAKPVAAPTSAASPLQPSVSNARAEFDDAARDQTNANPSPSDTPLATASDQASAASSPSGAMPSTEAAESTETRTSAVTTRWPDPAVNAAPASNAAQQQPAPATAVAPPPQLLAERSEPGPAVRVVGVPESQTTSYSIPMLLGGLAGALAFAGILGFAVIKFGNLSSVMHICRRPESIRTVSDTGSPPPWQQLNADIRPPHLRDPFRARREIEAQSRDIMEILSRASRGATT
jgi:hypothetical protein